MVLTGVDDRSRGTWCMDFKDREIRHASGERTVRTERDQEDDGRIRPGVHLTALYEHA